ncbi:18194_t:CDS:2, partial [Acaulospora morrowiae]
MNYLGQDVLISFLREKENWSYIDFLAFHHDDIVKLERSQNVIKLKRYWKEIVAERKKGPGKKGKGKENINVEETSTQPLNVRVLRKRNPINYSEADFSDVDSHVNVVEKR